MTGESILTEKSHFSLGNNKYVWGVSIHKLIVSVEPFFALVNNNLGVFILGNQYFLRHW